MTEIERIDQLREELHTHNYNYYVLNAPVITDQEFDHLMRELQDLEAKHPEHFDPNSPSVRVGSDLNKNFKQVEHKYPMLSLGNTYSQAEVTEFYDRVSKSLNEDFEICCEMKFDGKLIKVTYDIADVNGNEAWREVVHHPGATAIVVVTEDNKIVMERQFRYALQQPLLEIPAGKLDPNEEPLNCAKRELAEETGYRANQWIPLGTIATSPGFCNEVLHLYLAKDLTMGETNWDPDEYVELEYFTLPELLEAIKAEQIKDSKSLAALMLAMPYLK